MTSAKESGSPRAPSAPPSAEGGEAGSPGTAPSPSDDVPRSLPEPAGRPDVEVQNPRGFAEVSRRSLVPWTAELLATLLAAPDAAPDDASLTLRFVGDEEIAELNAEYRGKDGPTDVLTFPGDVPALDEARESWRETPGGFAESSAGTESSSAALTFPGESRHVGDVVISVPTARRQAKARGHDVGRELRILVLHGVLHALGYDHEVDDGTMERVEAELRRGFVDGVERESVADSENDRESRP